MTTTNYNSKNIDLTQIFKKYTTGPKASVTNCSVNSTDLNQIFAPLFLPSWSTLGSGLAGGGNGNKCGAIAIDSSGNVYAGGWFTTANGTSTVVNYIAKWNGTTWSQVGNGSGSNIGLNSVCNALAIDSAGNLYVGGAFTKAGGVNAAKVAKCNLSTGVWSQAGDGLNQECNALAFDPYGNLFAGGYFYLGSGGSGYIAKLAINTTTWITNLNGGLAGSQPCWSIACDLLGNVYAGGRFNKAGGTSGITANYIAKWTPSAPSSNTGTWSALPGLNNICYAIAIDSSNNVYAGGNFTTPANYIAKWTVTTSTWSALGTGLNNICYSLAFDPSGNLYAGGSFNSAGGITAYYIAKWTPLTSIWSTLNTSYIFQASISAIKTNSYGNVYAGGINFPISKYSISPEIPPTDYLVNNTDLNQIFAPINWLAFISGIYNGLSGGSATCYALIFDSAGNLYVGGSFTSVCNVSANNIAKFNGTTWSPLGSSAGNGLNGICYALAFDSSGNLYVGGAFTTASFSTTTISTRRIAKWTVTSSTWSALGGTGLDNGLNDNCYALTFDSSNNYLYVGGAFTEVRRGGPAVAFRIVRWTPTTSNWVSFGTLNNDCYALSLDSFGNVYAGGGFTTAGGITASRIAKFTLTTAAWSPLGNNGVGGSSFPFCNALAIDSSGNVYAGGSFTIAYNSDGTNITANRIAKFTVISSTWSALGSGLNSNCNTLKFDSTGNLYAGGSFTTADGNLANRIACWTPSSYSWSALGTGTNNGLGGICNAITFDSAKNLYVGGAFTTAGEIIANGIAKRVYV